MCITLLIPITLVYSNLPFAILHRHRINSCWSNLLLLCTPSSQQIPPDVTTGNKDLMPSELKCQMRTIKLVFNFYSLILLDKMAFRFALFTAVILKHHHHLPHLSSTTSEHQTVLNATSHCSHDNAANNPAE